MNLIMRIFLFVALLSGSVFAGDQGNGGYTGCTVDCPPPCTENCDPDGNGLAMGADPDLADPLEAMIGVDTTDIIVVLAKQYFEMLY